MKSGKTSTVTLVSVTPNMLELVWIGWHLVKGDGFPEIKTIEDVKREVPRDELIKFFRNMMTQWPPIMEWITFVWLFDQVSRAFCAQLERHRIGTSFFEKTLMGTSIGEFAEMNNFTN